MIKIFIADDHALIREGVKNLISKESDFILVGETANSVEIAELIKESDCDILVLDISMPGKNGLDVLKEIKCILPEIKVLIMSMLPEEQFARRSLKAGASGYLTKDSAPEELITALRRIAAGRKYVSQSLAEKLAEDLDDTIGKPVHELLSDREFQILKMMTKGITQKEISNQLNISVSTVNTYRGRLLLKLGLTSNVELIHYAYNNKLVEE